MPGRPRNPAAPRPHSKAPGGGLLTLTIQLDPSDVALADAAAADLARHTGTIPNRTRAIRWALRELAARLDTIPGPMIDPPD